MEDARISKCLAAKRESRSIEFKAEFLPTDARQSLEVLKDIVAIANSGGGVLAIGINNSGAASGANVQAVLIHDHAKYCDLIHKYTLQDFCDFEVVEANKDGHVIAIFLINAPDYPLVFVKPGTYPIENNKQSTAFGQGTLFFRHGAKSETGTTDDLRRFVQLRIREMEEQLLKGMRRVSEAPRGSQLHVIPSGPAAGQGRGDTLGVRLTTDKNAPGVVPIDRGVLCPYRKKELMAQLKKRLPPEFVVSPYDIQAINKVYNVLQKEQFCWQPDYSSPQ
jgi:hypothetical protein